MDINKLFADYASLKRMNDDLQNELKALENQIRDVVREAENMEIIGKEHKAYFREIQKKSFQQKQFEKEDPETYNKYVVIKHQTNFYFS